MQSNSHVYTCHLLLLLITCIAYAGCSGKVAIRSECERHIVFDSDRSGNTEIYVYDIPSQRVKRLTHLQATGAASRLPDFAPGGESIVFVREREDGLGHLYVVETKDEDIRRLTSTQATYENPTWSPSGDWIAFEMAIDNVWGLYRIRPDGSMLQQIGPKGVNLFHPSWSPEEDKIAVVTGTDKAWVVGVLDIHSGTVENLTEPGLGVGSVKWSPDGFKIAFDAVTEGNFDLYLLDLADRRVQRLTEHPAVDARPEWSPDGRQLVFHSTRDRGASVAGQERWEEFELYIFDLRTGEISRLTENSWFDGHPDWCTPLGASTHPDKSLKLTD